MLYICKINKKNRKGTNVKMAVRTLALILNCLFIRRKFNSFFIVVQIITSKKERKLERNESKDRKH